MEYRIVRKAYVNEYGKEGVPTWYIQQEVKILWFSLGWFYITHEESNQSGSYRSNTPFKSKEYAEKFATDFICKGGFRDDVKFDVVSSYKCENK